MRCERGAPLGQEVAGGGVGGGPVGREGAGRAGLVTGIMQGCQMAVATAE